MSPLDLPPDNLLDVSPSYAEVADVPKTESSSDPGYLRVIIANDKQSALVVNYPESGPPFEESLPIAIPEDEADFFESVRPFVTNGSITARLGNEAPDVEVEWDF